MRFAVPVIGALLAVGAATMTGTTATGQEEADPAVTAAVNARQAHMRLSAFNLGVLGAMAKGETDYDATAAENAAKNLNALAEMEEGAYWIPGSDMETLGQDVTETLAARWENEEKFNEDLQALRESSAAMVEAASAGVDDLRAAMGPLGKACSSCHEDFRVKDD